MVRDKGDGLRFEFVASLSSEVIRIRRSIIQRKYCGRNRIMTDRFQKIVEHCKQLCREDVPSRMKEVQARNERIIQKLSKAWGIDIQVAKEIFENNSNIDELVRICKKYF